MGKRAARSGGSPRHHAALGLLRRAAGDRIPPRIVRKRQRWRRAARALGERPQQTAGDALDPASCQKQPGIASHLSLATLSQVEVHCDVQHCGWSHWPSALPQTQSRTPA